MLGSARSLRPVQRPTELMIRQFIDGYIFVLLQVPHVTSHTDFPNSLNPPGNKIVDRAWPGTHAKIPSRNPRRRGLPNFPVPTRQRDDDKMVLDPHW